MAQGKGRSTRQTLYLFLGFLILFALSFSVGVMVGQRGIETSGKTERAWEDSTAQSIEERAPVVGKMTDETTDGELISEKTPEFYENEEAESETVEEIIEEPLSREIEATDEMEDKATQETAVPAKLVEDKAEIEASAPKEQTSISPIEKQTVKTPAEEEASSVKKEIAALPKIDADGKYTVQLGAFQDQKKADTFLDALKSRGYPVFLKQVNIPGSGTWYRARVGTFSSRNDAKLYADNLKNREPDVVKSVFVTIND